MGNKELCNINKRENSPRTGKHTSQKESKRWTKHLQNDSERQSQGCSP